MNRRDFLKSIGITAFGIPFIPKFYSGGIVDPKHYTLTRGITNPAEILKDLTKSAIEAQGLDLEIDEESFQKAIDYCEVKE